MPTSKLEQIKLKLEDLKPGDILRLQQNHLPTYYQIVSFEEFIAYVDSKLYNAKRTKEMVERGEMICVRVDGKYMAIPLDTFSRGDKINNIEEELRLARVTYGREVDKLQRLASENISLLEKAVEKESQPFFNFA